MQEGGSLTVGDYTSSPTVEVMAFTQQDYDELQGKIVTAALRMKVDGWWLEGVEEPTRRKAMKSRLTWEMIGSIVQVPKPLRTFYTEVM